MSGCPYFFSSEASGTGIPFQVIARAAMAATMKAEEQIMELVRKEPPMRKPANAEAAEYALFEQYWVDVLADALRKLRPYQQYTFDLPWSLSGETP